LKISSRMSLPFARHHKLDLVIFCIQSFQNITYSKSVYALVLLDSRFVVTWQASSSSNNGSSSIEIRTCWVSCWVLEPPPHCSWPPWSRTHQRRRPPTDVAGRTHSW
jgi:hypothetical protein